MSKLSNLKLRYKIGVGVATGAAILGSGAGAFAYWTGATGTGSGNANVGVSTKWAVAESTNDSTKLYPDAAIGTGNIATNKYTVTNNGKGTQHLATVTISIANSDGTAWSSQTDATKPACTASDFSVGGEAVGSAHVDTTLAGEFVAAAAKTANVTIQMIDKNANQDNCQGLTPPLYYVAAS